MKNTPIPVAVRTVGTGIGMKLPYIESSTVGEVAGKFSKASTAAKDDAYQLAKGTGNREVEVPPAFRQTDFASSYESRINQTPAQINPKIEFEGIRGESLSTLKPPPDPKLKSILDEAGIKGIQYKNGVPDFSPVSKAQVEINHMVGGTGGNGSAARRLNFTQADEKLAEQLNNSPELARKFGMESGEITWKQIEKYRRAHKLTWHELNDVKTVQLVPTEINSKFGHLGGVGEINAGAFMPDGFASKIKERYIMKINDAVFGELEFNNYDWIGYKNIEFFGNEVKVALIVRGEDDGQFEEEQYMAYNFLIERWQQLQQSILEPILDYYKQKRYELGYDVEFNENYPLIETATQILEKITLVGIFVPDNDLIDFLDIGLTFDCTWDMENGLGLCFVKGEVTEVGYQDVVL